MEASARPRRSRRPSPVEAVSGVGATLDQAVGIVDIGSNSIRLVVYDGRARTPIPVFNEKATCAIGRNLQSTGRLNPEGVELARAAIARFVRLAGAMQVKRLSLLATAAVREAEDGPAFAAELERRFGAPVRILSGGEEAELAALGVICSQPEADGMVADLGGGSLEVVMVKGRKTGAHATLPLGVLRIEEAAGQDRRKAETLIDGHLGALEWLKLGGGRALYTVGGSWRAVARVCIAQMDYPLHVLDNFTLPYREADSLVSFIARLSRRTMDKIPGVPKRRLSGLPLSALVLERLLKAIRPERLVFSANGMREGAFYQSLGEDVKRLDPLLTACGYLAHGAGRFPDHCDELMAWMEPLFPGETPQQTRLRRATCLLSDIFWNEHPDYRAEQAFLRVLRLPVMGLEHTDRAAMALAVYHRYTSSLDSEIAAKARALLDETRMERIRTIGYALRLGHTLSGGAPSLLKLTALSLKDGLLTLTVPADDPAFEPSLFDKRFEKLGRAINHRTRLVRL